MSEEYPIFEKRRLAVVYANQHGLLVVALGDGRWTVAEQPEPEPIDTTDFDEACKVFRGICADIGDLIGVPDFRGGFDDMETFRKSESFNTLEG